MLSAKFQKKLTVYVNDYTYSEKDRRAYTAFTVFDDFLFYCN